MITTSEIAPSPVLAPFVRCYTYRYFDTMGLDMIKPWHASHELAMPFFFDALPVHLRAPQTGEILKRGHYSGVIGIATQYNGDITFNGRYRFFEIIFKPNGFHKLFRISSSELTNQIICAEDIFGCTEKLFFEQLAAAKGLPEMAVLANAYLLRHLKNQKSVTHKDSITAVSHIMLRQAGLVNIDWLAYNANMSVRNFERRFAEQVGVSPKLFCCIARFNHAFGLKLQNPKQEWISIAHDCGYFDQMHLIKDFKKFAGSNPVAFLKQTPLTGEVYTSRVDA